MKTEEKALQYCLTAEKPVDCVVEVRKEYNNHSFEVGFILAAALIGGFVGGLLVGNL